MRYWSSKRLLTVACVAVWCASAAPAAWSAEGLAIPHEAALDRSAIRVSTLKDRLDDALILGNGDLNGLVWTEGGSVVLTVTKNDVWDARLDSKLDPPMPTLARLKELGAGDWKDRNYILPEGCKWEPPDSYHAHPYPCPRACARIRIGGTDAPRWTQIRAEGGVNTWQWSGQAAVMRIQGKKGASNGYSYGPLDLSTDAYPKLRVKLSGSANARYYVDAMGPKGDVVFASKWLESPEQVTERTFKLPAGQRVARLILYTWTEDGKDAQNRFEHVVFEGEGAKVEVDLGTLATSAEATLDIRRAVAHIRPEQTDKHKVAPFDLRTLANRSAFLLTSAKPIEIALEQIASTGLSATQTGADDGTEWVVQPIPGDEDWKGMTFAVALSRDPSRRRAAVAVVTSLESDDPRAAAVRLARSTCREQVDASVAKHEAVWQAFWARSGVEFDDALLESVWYRNLYFLRCVSRPGAISPGLFAGLLNDTPAWHGDYHTNYNIQQTFWAAYAANQCELAEPYDRLITEYRPRARWMAKTIFDCDGAYYPHVLFAYEPPEPAKCKSPVGRQYIHHVWGFTLGVAGFTVQPLWWRYKYDPDPEYLESTAYPAVREVANFYADFIDTCATQADGWKVVLGPSVSPEHWGWTPKFERNRDCAFDIAMFRFIFAAAIEGARTLKQDGGRVTRWRVAASRLPAYPLHDDGTAQIVVDVAGAPPTTYNIPVPATPVFPGDVVTQFSPPAERALFVRTIERLRHNGNNAPIMLAAARLRLDMPDAYEQLRTVLADRSRPNGTLSFNRLEPHHRFNDFGHYTEMFGAVLPVNETLLQSVGNVIRVFPGLPAGRRAAYTRLRAQGGFLVTARRAADGIAELSVESTRGGQLRLAAPWPATQIRRGDRDEWTEIKFAPRGIIAVEAKKGETLRFRRAPKDG